MKIGIVADDFNFSRFFIDDSIIRVSTVSDLNAELSLVIVNMDTTAEFSSYFSKPEQFISILDKAKDACPVVLYAPDYAPVVDSVSYGSEDRSTNLFNDLGGLFSHVDYLIIGDETYLDFAIAEKGDRRVAVSQPFVNPRLVQFADEMDIEVPVKEVFFDTHYFEKNGYVPDVDKIIKDVKAHLNSHSKQFLAEARGNNLDSLLSNYTDQIPFWFCTNNHYFSSEYIPRRYLEILANGGLIITNYTKAINKYLYFAFVYSTAEEVSRILDNYSVADLLRFRKENAALVLNEFNIQEWYAKLFEIVAEISGQLDERIKKQLVDYRSGLSVSAAGNRSDSPKKQRKNKRRIAVIYPIHNNGRQLYYRAFRSLLRSTAFDQLQIYLIDDGSTDAETIQIIKTLEKGYRNVTTFFFSDGGSGSASRPRNKGVEISVEPFIAFEDPDDETICDSYSVYLEALDKHKSFSPDVVSSRGGYMSFIHGKIFKPKIFEPQRGVQHLILDDKSLSPRMKEAAFRHYLNTHLGIFERGFWEKHKLRFLEGSFSEDNLVSLQLLALAPRVVSIPNHKCLYYAENEGSGSNSKVLGRFFDKWIPGTNEVNKLLNGWHDVSYVPRNIIRSSDSVDDCVRSLNRLEHLYDGTSRLLKDDREKWLLSFIRENQNFEDRQTEYYSDMNGLSYLDYIDFSDPSILPVICDAYPSAESLYSNAFIQSRLMRYKDYAKNLRPIVIVCSNKMKPFYCLNGIPVANFANTELADRFTFNTPRTVYIHFLGWGVWNIVKQYSEMRIVVFIHGYEVQPFEVRRPHIFDAQLLYEREVTLRESAGKQNLWRQVFDAAAQKPVKLVFVARSFAGEVFDDFDSRTLKRLLLAQGKIEIVHNIIDTDYFEYQEKNENDRLNILSIRPYTGISADTKYANDLAIKAVQYLHNEYSEIFTKLNITIIGGGERFDEITKPLQDFPNVKRIFGYLTHDQIKEEHGRNGLFLTPSRDDSQGVSRDEAMASGLVPITSNAGSIPEFVNEECGVLAPYDDYIELAKGIIRLYENPELFLRMSAAAAAHVRSLSSPALTVKREVELIEESATAESAK